MFDGERIRFVGRNRELDELRSALAAAIRGACRAVLLCGEPGIGKTRLAREFCVDARNSGALVCWGRCWEVGGAPSYWPWIEVIRSLLEQRRDDSRSIPPRITEQLAQIVPELANVPNGMRHISTPESARFMLFDAVATLLRTASSTATVVIIDDLHGADRPSVLLLSFLARELAESNVLLVATCRDSDPRVLDGILDPLARVGPAMRQRSLSGLAREDVAELIADASGRRPNDHIVVAIHDATAGNPFFVDEFLRSLLADGVLDFDASGPLRIPAGVRSVVRQRLGILPRVDVEVLDVAAVIGRTFDIATIAAATERSTGDVLRSLTAALRHGVVEQHSGRLAEFRFRHAVIREVVYEELAPERRLAIHRRVGCALEARSRSDPDRYAAELAHHFLMAAPLADDARFIDYATQAARRALDRMAYEEAIALYQWALDCLVYIARDERKQCELLIGLGIAQNWAGEASVARSTFEQAATLARQLDAADLFVAAALGVGGVEATKFTAAPRCDAAPALLREALGSIGVDDHQTRARVFSRLALHNLSVGSISDARALSAEAVRAARSVNDHETLADALVARHGTLLGPDNIRERCKIVSELISISESWAARTIAVRAYALRVTDAFELGDVPEIDSAMQAHRLLSERMGDPFERWSNMVWQCMRKLLDGRLDEALEKASGAGELASRVPGLHSIESNGPLAFVAQSLLIGDLRGDSMPVAIVDEYRTRYADVPAWQAAPLILHARSGDSLRVRQELRAIGRNAYGSLARGSTWLAAMAFIAEAIQFVDDRDEAAILYPMLLPYQRRNVVISFVACLGSAERYLGLLAATLGRWDDAAHHFEAALAMNARMGARPYIALTSYDYARLMPVDADEAARARAIALAGDALRLAREIGMRRLERDAGELLERLQRPAVGTPPGYGGEDLPRLEKAGNVWVLSHRGERVHVKDTKGLVYVAELLRQAGREVHVLDLVALTRPPSGEAASTTTYAPSAYADELLDAHARRDYRRRMRELTGKLEGAAMSGDPEQAVSAREEIVALRRELSRGVGLGRRPRHSSDSERARVSVARTIRLALGHIAAASPALGSHFVRSVRTGTFCAYVPAGIDLLTAESAPALAPPP